MAITSTQRTEIVKATVAMFGAAPGGYMTELTNLFVANGSNITNFMKALATTPAFTNQAAYSNFKTVEEKATSMASAYGLTDITTAGSAGKQAYDYFVAQLTAGVNIGEIFAAANSFLASTTDTAFATTKTLLTNKTAVAEYYTVTAAGTSTTLSTLQSTVSSVTATTDVSTDAAKAAVISTTTAATTGTTYTLTTGADAVTATSNNDTISGVVDFASGDNFSAADMITGGAGTDTLSLVGGGNAGAISVIGSQVTGIEVLKVNATAAEVVSISGVTGLTEVINNGSAAALTFGKDDATAGNDVNNLVALTINNATSTTKVVYSDTALAGTTDAMTVTMSGNGSATAANALTILTETAATNELETLNLNVTGTNGITLTTDGTQTSLTTINVTGAGSLALGIAADNTATKATTINASAATGNITVGTTAATLGAANHTVTLGSGNDAVYFGANLTLSDSVVGGAGTDTLGVSAALTASMLTNVSGFETVSFYTNGGSITQDTNLVSGITSYSTTSAANGHVLTLSNLTSTNGNLTVAGSDATGETMTLSLKDGSGLSDSLTVTLTNGASNAATTVATLTNVTGLETLNLVSNGGTGTNIITTDSVTAKHVITGSAGLNMGTAAATQIDASAFTGVLTVTASNTATNIQSGTAADLITLGTAADTVNSGAGNDTITTGALNAAIAADVIYGGTGNDTIVFRGTGLAGTITDYTTVAVVKDFTVGTSASASDFIQLSASGVYSGVALTTGAGAAASTATSEAVVVQTIAQNATAAAVSATANVFKLTTGVAFHTDLQTTFNDAIGTGTITGLATTGGQAVVFYDTTNSRAVIAVAQTAASSDTVLNTGDTIKIVGAIDMTSADYANFGATNFAAFIA